MTSHIDAYTTITSFFHANRTTVTQIELLPSSSSSILISGPHLGTPKQCLISAFTHARTLFPASPDPATILDATLIILLTASEHLTALNARKRVLRDPVHELFLLTSLLTSPLPRHNKSPQLWSHRRWLLTAFPSGRPTLAAELDVVRRSAAVHPRNYYAWDYARWACERLPHPPEGVAQTHLAFCWRHAADVGVWMFLATVLTEEEEAEQVVGEVMRFAREVAPGHESLWCFVRAFVGRGKVLGAEARGRVRRVLEGWVAEGRGPGWGEEAERECLLERRALEWIERFGET